jgi:hypothetical protein
MDGEMTRAKAIKTVSRRLSAAAIIVLALWSSGFGCLWCCASEWPAMMHQPGATMAQHRGPSCASRRRCCDPAQSKSGAAVSQTSPTADHCCPIGAHRSGPATFPLASQRQALAVTGITQALPVVFTRAAPPPITDTPPANKGSTYLRCCVFLI